MTQDWAIERMMAAEPRMGHKAAPICALMARPLMRDSNCGLQGFDVRHGCET